MSEDKPDFTDTEDFYSEGETNVEDASQEPQQPKGDVFDLGALNKELGTNYASKEEAVKGLKNLKSFVGSKEEKVEKKVLDEGRFIPKEDYERDMFYLKHADLEPYKELIDARSKVLGVSPSEVVEKDDYMKSTLEKLRGYDDTEKAKSVLMSNPRLGQVTDDLQLAREAVQKGDFVSAENSAVKAVLGSTSE
jgi:hypothetical protein